MDVSNFFWNFIDHELGYYPKPSDFERQMFNCILQGDITINTRVFDPSETNFQYLYFETFEEPLFEAYRYCQNTELEKLNKYMNHLRTEDFLVEGLECL